MAGIATIRRGTTPTLTTSFNIKDAYARNKLAGKASMSHRHTVDDVTDLGGYVQAGSYVKLSKDSLGRPVVSLDYAALLAQLRKDMGGDLARG